MRTHRSPVEWHRLFDQQQRSGLSQTQFCRQHGITRSAFSNARHRLSAGGAPAVAFVPALVPEPPADTPPLPETQVHNARGHLATPKPTTLDERQLTLILPGATLNLPPDISPRWLATLLREVAP